MSDFCTDAILLRKIEYGDHDYIITFLTQSRGKVSVIAKNAKKSVKRFSGALDLFSVNHIQCTFPKKNKDSLIILSQTDLELGFVNIRYDVFKTAYACYWVELVYLWLEEGKRQIQLYELLLFVLDMLNRSDIKMEVLSLLFQIRFMRFSGFSPNIESCENCNTLLDDILQKSIQFDFGEGKIICSNCLEKKSRYGMCVSKGTLKQLFWINMVDIQRAERIKSSLFSIKEGQILLESFISFHIGREFKSLKFLRRLRQEG
ncbi:MAG: DNA repair protein RecO [Desulfobacteraceae bacterium]|nr:DNA repair protein RecO [Desulfobacteraceae bacterium]